VRSADAVASLKRWGQRNDTYGQPLLAAASVIETIDDRQFRIVLKSRFRVLEALATMTTPTPFILPERLPQTDPYPQITEVDGSGPFSFVREEWQPGHKAAARESDGLVICGSEVRPPLRWRRPDSNRRSQCVRRS
jgi:peptide/nickel transport system substrate-binding protein